MLQPMVQFYNAHLSVNNFLIGEEQLGLTVLYLVIGNHWTAQTIMQVSIVICRLLVWHITIINHTC